MDTWKYKHPPPYDFMFLFNKVSGSDLNWFWKQWYFDWGYMDIGIKSFKDNMLIVENLGGRPMPFTIKVNYGDRTSSVEEVNPVVWRNKSIYNKKIETRRKITSIEIKILGNGDAVEDNNMWMIK